MIIAFRPRFWPASDSGRIARADTVAAASLCVFFYVSVIKVHNFSLFRVLYAIVPGPTATQVAIGALLSASAPKELVWVLTPTNVVSGVSILIWRT